MSKPLKLGVKTAIVTRVVRPLRSKKAARWELLIEQSNMHGYKDATLHVRASYPHTHIIEKM